MKKEQYAMIAIFMIAIATRLPFIFNGFGIEEDTYGLVLAARNMAETGTYEMSRPPGHPVQEFVLSWVSDAPDYIMNGFSVMFGALASVFFFLILKELKQKRAFLTTLAFTMVPVIYISSVSTIDYCWALAFILMSFYGVLKKRFILAGLFLGLAIGCRVTSVLFVIPLMIFVFANYTVKKAFYNLLYTGFSAIIVTFLLFLPALYTYGTGFFYTYSLPYPSFYKIVYKATFGVWGLLGFFTFCAATLYMLYIGFKKQQRVYFPYKGIVSLSLIMIGIHLFIYALLPEKSAFFIPALPFFFLLFSCFVSRQKAYLPLCILFVISPFLTSIQLADKERGSVPSALSFEKTISGQEIGFDFLYGPIVADYTKRKNKAQFICQFLQKYGQVKEKSVILCSFWLPQIEVTMQDGNFPRNPHVMLKPGISKEELNSYLKDDVSIYYLKEQEKFNIIKYQLDTREIGTLFIE